MLNTSDRAQIRRYVDARSPLLPLAELCQQIRATVERLPARDKCFSKRCRIDCNGRHVLAAYLREARRYQMARRHG